MPEARINVRGGEATLIEAVFENESLESVLGEARRLGLRVRDLRVDRVTKGGHWKSTKESTDILPVLYFEEPPGTKGSIGYVVAKRPEDSKYGLFRYNWTY